MSDGPARDNIIVGPQDGIPIVMLHGFLGSADDFHPLIKKLSPRYRCVAIDLPGHGAKPRPVPGEEPSFWAAVDDVRCRLEDLSAPPAYVVGYSMGGRIGFGLAARYPKSLRGAVLIGASPGIEDPIERSERASADDALAARLERGPFEALLRDWYSQPLFGDLRWRAGFPLLVKRRLRGDPRALADALRAMTTGRQPPLARDLARSAVPLLLVAGERDRKYRCSNDALASSLQAGNAIVPGCHHAVLEEGPDVLAALTEEFIAAGEDHRHGDR